MAKDVWDCEINGVLHKIIKKDKNRIWFKDKPIVSGFAKGYHIDASSGRPLTAHADLYFNQRDYGKITLPNSKIGSMVVSPKTEYVNSSGAVETSIIPMDSNIRKIDTRKTPGSIAITANASGYIFFVNVYPE